MRSVIRVALACGVMGLALGGCCDSKKEETSATTSKDPSGAASVPATAAAANPTSPTPAAAAGEGPGKVLAQCMKKEASQCKEIYRSVPIFAEDLCKGLDGTGVLTKGEIPCAKENLIATCEKVGEEQTEITYHYLEKGVPRAQQIEGAKLGCSLVDGKFAESAGSTTEAPKGAKPPAAPKK